MKLEITEKGVYDGKGERVAVGKVLTVKGDEIPANLVGKCRVIEQAKGRTAVTNPAKGAAKQEAEKPAEKTDEKAE